MRIDVVGRDVRVTDAIRTHAEEKGAKLTKYFDLTQQVTYTIEKVDAKSTYKVECLVDVEKHDDFVSSAKGEDVVALIDQVSQKAARQLTDFKEKLKLKNR